MSINVKDGGADPYFGACPQFSNTKKQNNI